MIARHTRLAPLALVAGSLLAAVSLRPSRAQDAARSSAAERRPPALLVKPDEAKGSEPLRISAASVSVTIVGNVASTTLELTFRNDLPRVLEGQLVLPLPPGATISSFALEVDGKLRPASVVEREKARVVFEEVVRRGVDPGLVEWSKGNNFTTRVYPIPANGTKRVVLGWDEPLSRDAAGKASYWLPLGFKGLDSFTTVLRRYCSGEVNLVQGDKRVAIPDSRKGGDALALPASGPKVDADDVRIEVGASGEPNVLVEPARVKPVVGALPELCWVADVAVPSIPSARVIPKRVTILWDNSGSSAGRDHAKERAFLEQYFAALGDAEARLVIFSNDVWEPGEQVFAVKTGKCPEILKAINALRPDGGTRFQCLDLKKLGANADAFLLFTDGMATFGEEGEPAFGDKPVTCVASGASLDLANLNRLARGGALVNLNVTAPADGVGRAFEPPLLLLFTSFEGVGLAFESENGGPSHSNRGLDDMYRTRARASAARRSRSRADCRAASRSRRRSTSLAAESRSARARSRSTPTRGPRPARSSGSGRRRRSKRCSRRPRPTRPRS